MFNKGCHIKDMYINQSLMAYKLILTVFVLMIAPVSITISHIQVFLLQGSMWAVLEMVQGAINSYLQRQDYSKVGTEGLGTHLSTEIPLD